jgi:hypothetical protein
VLHDYPDGDDELDRSTVKVIGRLTEEALQGLKAAHASADLNPWPYELVSGKAPEHSIVFSASTQTMILHALAVSTGIIKDSVLAPALDDEAPFRDKVDEVSPLVTNGITNLVRELTNDRPAARENNRTPLTDSKTWGLDDPLTLTWLNEVLDDDNDLPDPSDPPATAEIRRKIEAAARRLLEDAAKNPPGTLLNRESPSRRLAPHPFILLRTVQLANSVNSELAKESTSALQALFTTSLNAELARSSIRNGGFDPASLVFSLEGLLAVNASGVQESLVARVLDVIGASSEIAAHWRPVHPIFATPQGLVLLPQSVEVANSVLRIAQIWERERRTDLFALCLPALRQYAEWVTSCAVRLEIDSKSYVGWQSEHTFEPNTIHLWATSQVLLFLEHFSEMLRRHIARASRRAAGLEVESFSRADKRKREADWAKAKAQEPLAGLESTDYACYGDAEELYVQPRVDGDTSLDYYSMLLYGPPGTGKTEFAKAIAKRLDYDFISVSPSDFTRSGESGVEARAQQLFGVLEDQSRCVVLFDEIDRLIVDRDSAQYANQGDIFQLMTPSMLTKINNLRSKKNCIFIIATNYADRIDGAIKRPGRIDKQLLLLPPDLVQRQRIITGILTERKKVVSEETIEAIARATPLFIYKELHELVLTLLREGVLDEGSDGLSGKLEALLSVRSPTISLSSYRRRIMSGDNQDQAPDDWSKTPAVEFALLAYLVAECGEELAAWQVRVVDAVRNELSEEVRDRFAELMR